MISPSTTARLTIGMAAYRGGGIARGIESLLAQSFGDFQLHIYDDASPDGLEAVCRPFVERDPRVRYVHFPWNVGGIRNFTRLALNASTEYFMWATDDDAWSPEYLARCIEVLDADSEAAACYTGARLVTPEGTFIRDFRDTFRMDQDNPAERLEAMMRNLDLCHPFFSVFRTRCLHRGIDGQTPVIGLATRRDHVHDVMFLAELALSGKIVQIPEPLFVRTRLTGRQGSLEQRNARLERLTFGQSRRTIHLTFIRFAYNHMELVRQSLLPENEKAKLISLIPSIFMGRFGPQIRFEIERAIQHVLNETYHLRWGETATSQVERPVGITIDFCVAELLAELREASFFQQDFPGLALAQGLCHSRLGEMDLARALVAREYRRDPDYPHCRDFAEALGLPDEQQQQVRCP